MTSLQPGRAAVGTWLDELRSALAARADAGRATEMAAYMRDHFEFLGVPAGERRIAQRPALGAARDWPADALMAAAEAAWAEPEREFQYFAADLLRAQADRLRSSDLDRVEGLIRATPWWDTVDPLAIHVVGPMVRRLHVLVADMDRWVSVDDGKSSDLWVRRSAVLHQLMSGPATDEERLFRHCAECLHESDFFMRKAIGWALRQYARADPAAVVAFLEEHSDEVSGLTRREALKRLPARA